MKLRLGWLGVPLALVACGDDGGAADHDAAAHDAEVADAAPPDAIPEGPVTVTVMSQGNPIPGIDIVFSDPGGAVVSHEQTGVDGSATEVLLAGSAATIAVDVGGRIAITFAAVEPGDDLVFSFEDAPSPEYGSVSVALPGAFAGAASYEVRLGCSTLTTTDPTQPLLGGLTTDCLGGDQAIDVLAVALDDMGAPLAYDHAKAVAGVPAGTTSVTLDAWQTTFDPLTITLTNAPASTAAAGLEGHFRVDGLDFLGFGGGGAPVGGTVALASAYPQGFAERLQYLVFIAFGTQQDPAGFAVLLGGRPDAPATVTHDLAAELLPLVDGASAADDAGRVALSWTADGPMTDADGALVLVSWSDADIQHQWFALLPPDAASPFALPAMPDALAGFRSTASSTFDEPTVIFGAADWIDGYDAWRAGAGFSILGERALDAIPPGGGLLRATIGGQLPGG